MIKNKKLIFLILFWFNLCFLNTVFCVENKCEYTEKIDECKKVWEKRSIQKFICIDDEKEKQIYQIILDDKISKIDEEVEEYLTDLEKNKDKYFWPNLQKSYLEAIDEIESKFSLNWEYYYIYKNICWENIIWEVQKCQWWKTSIKESTHFFQESLCLDLIKVKLSIYKEVAYDILLLNKVQVKKDSWKKYVQKERQKYDEILNKIMINLWYLERIMMKWKSKTENPL